MNFAEMQAILGGILQVQRQLQENQLQAQAELSDLRSITNSNSCSILANTETSDRRMAAIENKLSQLIEIVGTYAEATNQRLDTLENQDRE